MLHVPLFTPYMCVVPDYGGLSHYLLLIWSLQDEVLDLVATLALCG